MTENLARNLMKYGFDQIHAAPSGMRSPSRAKTEILLIAYACCALENPNGKLTRIFIPFFPFGSSSI